MLNITEAASNKIVEILADETDPNLRLRVFVEGGGCSGFQYGFTIDTHQPDNDFVIPAGATSVLVDGLSAPYLSGAIIDFKDDLGGARFIISNPSAVSTCGCGSSFSM